MMVEVTQSRMMPPSMRARTVSESSLAMDGFPIGN